MKKAISLLLILALLCTGVALASEWQPGKPYEDVAEVDLTESLGYMIFSPNNILTTEYACQRLFIYLPRTDVKAGDGSLHIYDSHGEFWSAPMASEAVSLRPMHEDEMTLLHWEDGVCFEIRLGRTLPLNESCYVNLDAYCIATLEGNIGNPAITGTEEWQVMASGAYGVGGLTYLRDGETVAVPTAGDEIRFDLTMDGDAAIAAIYSPDGSVSFDVNSFSESCEVIGEVTGDAPAWGVVFLDAGGAELAHVNFD